jgi:hypothetical protein
MDRRSRVARAGRHRRLEQDVVTSVGQLDDLPDNAGELVSDGGRALWAVKDATRDVRTGSRPRRSMTRASAACL